MTGVLVDGGANLGGPALGQLGQGAVGVYFLKFSREYETEADLLGAQIMARAGYDPRDLANMFKTIEQQTGGGGGGFFSDHPSPSNRYQRINEEAARLQVSANSIKSTPEFRGIQERLRGYDGGYSSASNNRSRNYPSNNNPSNNYPNNRS